MKKEDLKKIKDLNSFLEFHNQRISKSNKKRINSERDKNILIDYINETKVKDISKKYNISNKRIYDVLFEFELNYNYARIIHKIIY